MKRKIKIVSQFNDNLIIQYNEWNEHKVNKTIEIFQFENTRTDVKVLQSLRIKEINISNKSCIDQPGEFSYKS